MKNLKFNPFFNNSLFCLVKNLQKHMRNQLGPSWFQELSENQIAAANLLFTAVGNDGITCQLKRVIPILKQINIYPLPTSPQLVAALKFARSSDLAFLWFLYDRIYRTGDDVCTQTSYTLNERLILSCICHLDMMLTLRELERILPKVEIKNNRADDVDVREEEERNQVVKKNYKSPYNRPLPKSKIPHEEVIKKPMRIQPKFEIYNLYKDPYYIIENEVNRWFSISSLMPTESECVAQKIVRDLISATFNPDSKKIKKALCGRHKEESSKFYLMMKRILENSDDNDLQTLMHLNRFERGIVAGIQQELSNVEKNFRENQENLEKNVIVKTLLRQILENAANLEFIHLCEQCEECIKSKDLFDQLLHEQEEKNKKIEGENSSRTSVVSSIIQYCHQTSRYGPLTFDYEKIFATSFLDDQDVVKNSINTALKLEKHLTEDNAITVCLRDMWRLEMRLWNEKRQADIMDRQKQVKLAKDEGEKLWGNRRKILKLLDDAIGVLRRNPKFVFAALPDSNRLPFLREWILQKYGVRHTDEEERRKFTINKQQRELLMKSGMVPRPNVPTFKHFGIKKPRITIIEAMKLSKEVKCSQVFVKLNNFKFPFPSA